MTSQQWTNWPNRTPIGQPFALGVVIGTGVAGVAPTGTVTFYDGSTALIGTVNYMAQGVGVNVVLYATGSNFTLNTAGNHTITAQYGGDKNYGPSTSSPVTVAAQYPIAMKITESATAINYGQSVTITSTIISPGTKPPMSGQLNIYLGSTNLTPITSSLGTGSTGNQVVTGTVMTVPQFSGPISATYYNDPVYVDGSTFGDFISVNIPDFSIPNGSTLTLTAGQTVTETVNVTPLSTTPSTVTVTNVSGQPPPGFSVSLSASSVNLNGTTVPITLTVATQTAPTSSSAIKNVKRSLFLANARQRTWLATSICGALVCVLFLFVPSRRYAYRGAFIAGLISVMGFALGCGGGGGSGGSGGGGGSGQATPTVTIATSNARVPFLSSFNLTATVTSSQSPTGTVIFAQNGMPFGSPVQVVSGQATVAMPNDGLPQVVTFTASYSGDAHNAPAQTQTGVVEVYQGTWPILIQGQTGGLTRTATFPSHCNEPKSAVPKMTGASVGIRWEEDIPELR